MKPGNFPHADAAALDQLAWRAIKGWPGAAGFDPVRDGLDFEELTRWALWDKVGRALRAVTDPEGFAFEEGIVAHRTKASTVRGGRIGACLQKISPGSVLARLQGVAAALGDRVGRGDLARARRGCARPAVYVPQPTVRTEGTAAALIARGYPVILSTRTHLPGYAGARVSQRTLWGARCDRRFARDLHAAVCEGLETQGIPLLAYDVSLLFEQVATQLSLLDRAEGDLAAYAPAAVLVHGDNHSPYQEYVAIARRRGIPVMTSQHGLDCERYYLDDVYASALAVWSDHRRLRYEQDSGRQPEKLQVTGNPAFDGIASLPEKIDREGEYLLWITRPHASKFCYAPSRKPREGLEILETLLDCLDLDPRRRLIIKPHSSDYAPLYVAAIARRNCADRVAVADSGLSALLGKAAVVISEDSTGGLEAMLQGKILVHAHFAATDPVLPFCRYAAALPGFSPEELAASLARAERLSVTEREEMCAGQRRFVADFAGELDGRAAARQLAFYEAVLNGPRS